MPLRDALLQAFVSHLNVEVPSPLVFLPETNLNVPFVPVHVSHHRKPRISGPIDLQQNPDIIDLWNGPFTFLL